MIFITKMIIVLNLIEARRFALVVEENTFE